MSTLADIGAEVLRRVEEANPPTFWNLADEIYPAIVEATNELCLITGEPEIKQTSVFTISANQSIFTIPSGGIALLRMEAPGYVKKTSVYDLDQTNRTWPSETAALPKRWFPFGIGQFGIYPQLSASVQCLIAYIRIPITTGPPYTGTESIPFREEYREALIDYAEHILRIKEAGQDFIDSIPAYDRFLARASELSKFGQRVGKLRFSRYAGSLSQVTELVTR